MQLSSISYLQIVTHRTDKAFRGSVQGRTDRPLYVSGELLPCAVVRVIRPGKTGLPATGQYLMPVRDIEPALLGGAENA